MKPVKFRGYNCTYAENQAEYLPLPAYKHGDKWGTVTACWRLNLLERIRVLFSGRVYVSLLCFEGPLTPQLLETKNPTRAANPQSEENQNEES